MNGLPVELHPAVSDEINDAHDWYEQRRAGLGGDFLDEVQRVLNEIPANPARYPVADADIREGPLSGSRTQSTTGSYRVLADRIRVLAVYHAARDPAGWQSRA